MLVIKITSPLRISHLLGFRQHNHLARQSHMHQKHLDVQLNAPQSRDILSTVALAYSKRLTLTSAGATWFPFVFINSCSTKLFVELNIEYTQLK